MKQHPARAWRSGPGLATGVLDDPRTPWWYPETWDLPEIYPPNRVVLPDPPVTAPPADHAAIIVAGDLVQVARRWVDEFAADGTSVRLVDVPSAKRLDTAAVVAVVGARLPIIVVEDHPVIGALGRAVAEAIASSGSAVPLLRVGVPRRHPHPVGVSDSRFGIPGRPGLLAWIRSNTRVSL